MAKKENAVAEIKEANVPVVAAFADDLELYVAENDVKDIKSDEIITPRIGLLQSTSPQTKKSHVDYVSGAEEGMIYNGGTKKLYDGAKGLLFVPCFTQRTYNEWIPVDQGGGLVQRWGENESFKNSEHGYVEEKGKWQKLEVDEKGKQVVKSEIVKTADYYVLVVDEETGAFTPAVIGFTGTKYKVHRKLINDISIADYVKKDGTCITPPPFMRVYRLTTIPESNDTNSWFNYRWERIGTIESLKNSSAIWNAAKEFRKLVIDGVAKAADEFQEEAPSHDPEAV